MDIAIWAEQKTNDSGQQYVEHSFKLTKNFKSKTTQSGYDARSIPLFGDDLLIASELLRRAWEFTQVKADVLDGQKGGQRGRR